MTEYEMNKQKLQEYRRRGKGNKVICLLCNIMEWFNERCIKI